MSDSGREWCENSSDAIKKRNARRVQQKRAVDRIVKLADWDMLQIQQAASGCIDKTIGDWVYLDSSLMKLGIFLHPETPAMTVTAICQFIEAASGTRLECMSCGQVRPYYEDVCGQCTYKTDGSDRRAIEKATGGNQ